VKLFFLALAKPATQPPVVAFPEAILPDCLPAVTDWLRSAGAHGATLFGSSLYAANLGIPQRASDCDLHIASHDIRWWALQDKLAKRAAHFEFSDDHPIRPPRLHFLLHGGVSVDASISYGRRSPQYMAAHGLFGVTAIAADVFTKKVCARPDFFADRQNQHIRVLDTQQPLSLLLKYQDKLTQKLPHFTAQPLRPLVSSCGL
jgi:hypothetical protein